MKLLEMTQVWGRLPEHDLHTALAEFEAELVALSRRQKFTICQPHKLPELNRKPGASAVIHAHEKLHVRLHRQTARDIVRRGIYATPKKSALPGISFSGRAVFKGSCRHSGKPAAHSIVPEFARCARRSALPASAMRRQE